MSFLILAVGAVLTLEQIVRDLEDSLPDTQRLARYRPPETTRIYSRDGVLIAAVARQDRTCRKLSEISPHVVDALTAAEDTRFYQHRGVDVPGVLRALRANLRHGQVEQGASTVTMQLARHFFLDQEQSLERKAREALLALKLDREFTKDRLLELYLNEMYFGAGAYGIASAASRYFQRSPDRLTPAQSALLVGMLQAPTALSPLCRSPGLPPPAVVDSGSNEGARLAYRRPVSNRGSPGQGHALRPTPARGSLHPVPLLHRLRDSRALEALPGGVALRGRASRLHLSRRAPAEAGRGSSPALPGHLRAVL
ncbi:MAG: transglycosylase domain-containing protein [Armatimonadetes bacterium]|nr:transglycosylase domain-containing protein [Armatimonadota bacterium]